MRNPEITKNTSTPTKPPRKHRHAGVEGDDQEHGDGAQPLDVGPEPAPCPAPSPVDASAGSTSESTPKLMSARPRGESYWVGPKRSTRMWSVGRPRSTSRSLAASAKPVEPQTYAVASGRSSASRSVGREPPGGAGDSGRRCAGVDAR